MANHQQKQIEVVNQIEEQIQSKSLQFMIVSPVDDFENDPRICLTSVHIPSEDVKSKIQELLKPLVEISPEHAYYSKEGMHMTIKNLRVINDPPHFIDSDIEKAKRVFSETIPNHKKYYVYFYRLLLFPNSIALIGTTDPELDNIILDLDQKLRDAGIPDDKTYANSKYFFCNMTLVRFNSPISETYKKKIQEISQNLSFDPYRVDSVSLVTCNAIFKKLHILDTWKIQ